MTKKENTLAWGKLRFGKLVVTDAKGKVVPAAVSFASATATQGNCSEASSVVTCDFDPIASNYGMTTARLIPKRRP